jgi:SM-20-related protein
MGSETIMRATGASNQVRIIDGFLPNERREELYEFLEESTWEWGWRSNRETDRLRFWHKHYAGPRRSDRRGDRSKGEREIEDRGGDCSEELKINAPLVWCFWDDISRMLLPQYTLVRAYVNCLQYGSDGTVHTDSVVPTSLTCVYYPHARWDANWGGETLFYNKTKDDVIACCYPKPGRLIFFPGTIPHRAAGVSRTCDVLRIILAFKLELRVGMEQAKGQAHERAVSAGKAE